jgi:protein-tyrosine phosphatase
MEQLEMQRPEESMSLEDLRDGLVARAPGWLRRSAQLAFRPRHRENQLHEWRRARSGLPRLDGQPTQVVVLCYGNICRSPFAARLLALRAPGLIVRSAGLEAREGKPAHPLAVRTAASFDLDLSDHAAHLLEADDLAWADLVLGMEGWHRAAVARRWPQATGKLHLLGDFLSTGPFGIEDPFGQEEIVFQRVFARLAEGVEALAERLDEAGRRDGRDGHDLDGPGSPAAGERESRP